MIFNLFCAQDLISYGRPHSPKLIYFVSSQGRARSLGSGRARERARFLADAFGSGRIRERTLSGANALGSGRFPGGRPCLRVSAVGSRRPRERARSLAGALGGGRALQ